MLNTKEVASTPNPADVPTPSFADQIELYLASFGANDPALPDDPAIRTWLLQRASELESAYSRLNSIFHQRLVASAAPCGNISLSGPAPGPAPAELANDWDCYEYVSERDKVLCMVFRPMAEEACRNLAAGQYDDWSYHEELAVTGDLDINTDKIRQVRDSLSLSWVTSPAIQQGAYPIIQMFDELRDVFYRLKERVLQWGNLRRQSNEIGAPRSIDQETKVAETAGPEFVFQRNGDGFDIRGFGQRGHISARGCKGLYVIYWLVQRADQYVPMQDLKRLEAEAKTDRPLVDGEAAREHFNAGDDDPAPGNFQTKQPALDKKALSQIRQEVRRLANAIKTAEENDGHACSDKLTRKRDALLKRLKKDFGLRGRLRYLGDDWNRFRSSVTTQLKRACRQMRESGMPHLANHFEGSIKPYSGDFIYRNMAKHPWQT